MKFLRNFPRVRLDTGVEGTYQCVDSVGIWIIVGAPTPKKQSALKGIRLKGRRILRSGKENFNNAKKRSRRHVSGRR